MDNDGVKKNKEVSVNVRMTQKLRDGIKNKAEEYGLNSSEFIRAVMAREIFGVKIKKLPRKNLQEFENL